PNALRPSLPLRAALGGAPSMIAPADPRRTTLVPQSALRSEADLRTLAGARATSVAYELSYGDRDRATHVGSDARDRGSNGDGGNGHGSNSGYRRGDDYGRAPHRPALGKSSPETVRTALCTEVRDGVLRVFMPPVEWLEDYLDLVAAIEDTAHDLKLPVLLEGYTPPHDPRMQQIKVTPDPGVIEVNTHPVETWDDLVRNTHALYEEARLCRLGTEKFMLDGRHTGTGGGNHIVVGGPTTADSPLLRRPDLLRSLVGFWNNHPCLSYLFSGAFVGPTSQAPRIDEARNDQVHEIELAFKQIPDHGPAAPWLVDRVFRNLLVDSTGNTHRTELCIDKLYAPESASGRLGLLEMRGFEMPPHAQMSLTQHLLIRALVAYFWKQPYRQPLVRWRTEVHDRFILPHFVEQDLDDVIFELNQAGYPLQAEWFASHLEFRFPVHGTIEHRGLVLRLRQAIEPWHVLGEVPGIHSAVRQVDSSLERLEVFVEGMVDPRHRITCNRVAVPLHPTGTNGQYVAGVRYRAWQPPQCLHPTIGVHSPLVFDVFDTWSQRSIGGCTYHVAHPGGRNYERFPVNAYEAEGRRGARFWKFGHTPGQWSIIEPTVDKEFPFTLDLRRV
ncbi:MAG TPA: transglutaminase family protein, partial [Pirellulales bacterium]|nr:transglutaminase family protein [Pirellulales bacterium]